ncbi:beta-ketoacyl synthase N-terminal-like domain-containing protein [Niabella drilacis]|uniref:Beta-ketoacyl synthase, N-terminal domain n=1 Tax=Niabella drilacis (strain DSM 25811 / CCM 8410 / CCUG 62505 / LMG 26954 / E90) TaxID=1285928 RepID=A0A1G6Q914_NIADE|nr:beta-ketoacyl synthase N-terminal-like domain-containing protein [Niabella drilacis]SDC88145.1 Beta-ketoacyl synthase, N-terminal domain [Niabella drilacis]
MSENKDTGEVVKARQNGGGPVYVRAARTVSPQGTFEELLENPAQYLGDRLACKEPDYSKYIDPKLIRRMSRIIKMGAAAAMECLQDAGQPLPDAIITGTAYGCLADTDQFLTRMVEFNEELLSPTAFIQSTHNTVGAQIALMLKCHHYNNTYVHRGSSFEAAMMDAIGLMHEEEAGTVLVGGVDEIIEKSHVILSRFGLYKKDGNTETLTGSTTNGTMAGEGAAFFLLAKEKGEKCTARLDAMQTWYKPAVAAEDLVNSFLESNGVSIGSIDLLITGENGDLRHKEHYGELKRSLFTGKPIITYKQFCGEYPTSSAFALWLASMIVNTGKVPGGSDVVAPQRVLIYNNYKLQYPTLYLLSAC